MTCEHCQLELANGVMSNECAPSTGNPSASCTTGIGRNHLVSIFVSRSTCSDMSGRTLASSPMSRDDMQAGAASDEWQSPVPLPASAFLRKHQATFFSHLSICTFWPGQRKQHHQRNLLSDSSVRVLLVIAQFTMESLAPSFLSFHHFPLFRH